MFSRYSVRIVPYVDFFFLHSCERRLAHIMLYSAILIAALDILFLFGIFV